MINRKDKKRKQRQIADKLKFAIFFVVIFSIVCLFGTKVSATDVTVEDYNGKPIGVLVGPLMEETADRFFPNSEHLLFNSYPDCITALLTNKIDGYLADEPSLKMIIAEQPEITYIPERLMTNNYSFAFRKDDEDAKKLCDELNEFIRKCREDGTMAEIDEIWFGSDEERKIVDMSDLRNDKRVLRVATTSTDAPFSYIKDGKNVGYDIDLVVRFCKEKGYGLELVDVDFAGRIPEVESGKCDFTTDMNVTEERMQQVLFSEPTSYGGIVLAIRKADLNNYDDDEKTYESIDELSEKRIGVQTGSIHDGLVAKRLPSAKISYFTSAGDLSAALKAGQVDSIVLPQATALAMCEEDRELAILEERLLDARLAFAFGKSEEGKKLNEMMSEYIIEMRQSGDLDKLHDKWFTRSEEDKTMDDHDDLEDINGTLTVAISDQTYPYFYLKDGQEVGFEIEIITSFCKKYGYGLKLEQMNFDGILASVQSGKCDMAANCLAITEERKESVDFSESHASESVVIVVLKKASVKTGFFEGVKDSFIRTFIRENRWKLFLQGIYTTMLITLLSVICGTLLGFVVFMLCRNGNIIANGVTRFCVWMVQGMPMVVLLMVLYYIIFNSVAISGIFVAVIGFSATFGSAVYGLLKMAVGTIDRGQYEAAYALGHSNRQTFYRIILPQAIPHILPAYQSEIVSLIKATAVVGYIAVQDLTKMGDIVRSRTYEAFFPLIAITIIYFVLEGLLGFIVSRIRINTDLRRRRPEDILKGVKIHD